LRRLWHSSPFVAYATAAVSEAQEIASTPLVLSSPGVADSGSIRIDRFDPHIRRWTLMAIPCSAASVPDQVAFRLAFPKWLSIQTRRDRRLIQALACGETTSEAARRFHISAARVSQLRLVFFRSWRAFQGEAQHAPATIVA
jgi:hypothetical protein